MVYCMTTPHNQSTISLTSNVDLLVLGGSIGAVACALSARKKGLRVLLAAPLHGLAEDVADHWRFEAGDECNDPLARRVFPDGLCPTPLHARLSCDAALLEAGVDVLFGTLPCGLLKAGNGDITGAILAHRGGRSAVQAHHIVDASMTASFARLCGASFESWKGGTISVHSRLLARDPKEVQGTHLRPIEIPPSYGFDSPEDNPLHLIQISHDIQLDAWETPALNDVEAKRQLASFQAPAFASSDWGFFLPPVGLTSQGVNTWNGAGQFDLGACASDHKNQWVLSSCCRISRDVSAAFTAPAASSLIGWRLGEHIALTSENDALDAAVAILPGENISGTLSGMLSPLRRSTSDLQKERHIPIDQSQAPTLETVDVLINGGGTGGSPAGISAARAKANTLICERMHRLGGVGTLGRIGRYWFGNRSGFTSELDKRVLESYGEPRFAKQQGAWWVLENKQDSYLRMFTEAGGRCWFGAVGTAALMEGDVCKGALIASRHGPGIVHSRANVDASGSADLAAAAGAPCRITDADHIAVQGTGLPPVDPRSDYQNSDHDFCDDSDVIDVTRILMRARVKFKGAWDTGLFIDSRERRQIRGQYEITPLDICCDRNFPDAIWRAKSNFDSHGFTIHPVFMAFPMDKKPMNAWIPYRCLLPKQIDGILVTGLGMSAHRDALPVIRMQPDVQNTGFSAGLAAAIAAQKGIRTSEVNVQELQKRLVTMGHLGEEVLAMNDSFPLPVDEVHTMIANDLTSLKSIAAAFAGAETYWPQLKAQLSNTQHKETAALILGLQGFKDAAIPLRKFIHDSDTWDEGWRFRGMGQFGRSLSQLDCQLIALAHCGTADDIEILNYFSNKLNDDPALSHVRAISWAATVMAQRFPEYEKQLADMLEQLLEINDMSGWHWSNLETALTNTDDNVINTQEREYALRELHLAVAAFRCGSQENALNILNNYSNDLRAHYAKHAGAVLNEARVSPKPYALV